MSCDYCQNGKKILNKEVPFAPFTEEVIGYDDLICFIDRGYLRLVMEGSEQCLGHGEKVKIDYCPYCGEKLTKLKE